MPDRSPRTHIVRTAIPARVRNTPQPATIGRWTGAPQRNTARRVTPRWPATRSCPPVAMYLTTTCSRISRSTFASRSTASFHHGAETRSDVVSEPFLGEMKMVGFNFPPRGWALCEGQMLAINQNQALFSLLGTIYGGDGVSTFALPDMRGRIGIGVSDRHPP